MLSLACLFSAILPSCSREEPDVLRVAVAANMMPCMQELSRLYMKQSGVQMELVSGSSGSLLAQIEHGAPFHLFLSADTTYPGRLHRSGLSLGVPVVYAIGRLVLWSEFPELNLDSAQRNISQFRHIAVPNPKTAPYGVAARNFLMAAGIWDSCSTRLVYGENVNQVNQFIRTQAVEFGITSVSGISGDLREHTRNWQFADTALYKPILQALVALSQTGLERESLDFVHFIRSAPAQMVLREYGYLIP